MDFRHWRLYAKFPGTKRFQAIDWREGCAAGTLIHATLFSDVERGKIEGRGDLTCMQNTEIEFQWRKV